MARKLGKYKIIKQEYEYIRLEQEGGNIGGSLNIEGDTSIEGDVDVLNTISGSGGTFLTPGDISIQTSNAGTTQDILISSGEGATLAIHNSLIYSNGTQVGIGTTEPKGKLEVNALGSNVVLSNLPTTQPTITGSLWLSGSGPNQPIKSKYLVVFTGE